MDGHGIKVGPGSRDPGDRHGIKVRPGPWDPGPRDPEPYQSLIVGPGTLLKFEIGTPGPSSKFKSGTLIIIFLHCLTCYVLDKYITWK